MVLRKILFKFIPVCKIPNSAVMMKNRLGLIYFFALCMTEILAMSEEMQELVDNLHNACVAETGAAEDMIINARNGDFADDEKFKCYFKCIFDQMGCMAEDGTVDADATVAIMPPEIADKVGPVILKCAKEVGANPCETSWLVHKCFQKAAPADYFVP